MPGTDDRYVGVNAVVAQTAGWPVARPDPLDRPRVVVRVCWASGVSEQVRGYALAWTREHVLVHLITGHVVWMCAADLRLADSLDT